MCNQSEQDQLDTFKRAYWSYYMALENRFLETERFCAFSPFSPCNKNAYSIEYLSLILSTCGEKDVLGKAIASHFFPDIDLDKASMPKWGYYVGESLANISNEIVEFKSGYQFRPFDCWHLQKAINKNGKKSHSLLSRNRSV